MLSEAGRWHAVYKVSGTCVLTTEASCVVRQEHISKCSSVQRDLVDPAVNGTKNVLSSVVKSKATVRRVVLTSSFAGRFFATACQEPLLPQETRTHRLVTVREESHHFRYAFNGKCVLVQRSTNAKLDP